MKTIKIIDLLNKIANGVAYSRKARIRYFDRKNVYEDECILNEVAIGYRLYNQNIELNDEVEILEDEFEDIEEMFSQGIKDEVVNQSYNKYDLIDLFSSKINEVIKNQKKIIERLNEK